MTREETEDMVTDELRTTDPNPKIEYPDEFNVHYLRIYYGNLFPYNDIFRWLSYGNDGKHPGCDEFYFGRREFSFTLENDVYVRYMSFKNASAMEESIKGKCPFKIDIGAVYNVDPYKRRAYAESGDNVFTPVERELVFDIDITDYDDVRYCCSGADVCHSCWPLMTVAIKVIDTALREDFGFKHILWVFSGRRGVHCWVCDAKARRLTNEQRAAIAEYFHVYKGNENKARKVALMGHALHPFLARSYVDFLKNFFEDKLLATQKIFSSKEKYEKVLEMIPDEDIKSELREKWENAARPSLSEEAISITRWEQLKNVLLSKKQKAQSLRMCIEEIVFTFAYPRIDLEVSKQMNHLLKAPFCVHPKTGLVCVPIDPNNCDEFDPLAVPTLSLLLQELNSGGSRMDVDLDDDSDRSSLGKSVDFFRSSFLEPLLKSCKEDIESSYKTKLQKSKDSMSW
ncbi:PREDICTED: DNA primase small subunit isoform X2 [Tarenaya hassleriana]|uniref:DNA primase small subunit isoform X2 n=1 Tax=Tarenaya hassleriana TaxID=28532 RepID=UPI00053C798A|nr:PREDICTED: DNA primase small subunit isoform X2 [Tarenaya hassleriana]